MTARNYKCVLCGDLVRPSVIPIEIVRAKVCAKCYCTPRIKDGK